MSATVRFVVQVYENRDGHLVVGALLEAIGEDAAERLAQDAADVFGGAVALRYMTDDTGRNDVTVIATIGNCPVDP